MDTQRREWDELNEHERNCLMWPDFLLWEPARNVEICRPDPDASLGLVSVTVQDQETEKWYNITKRIKENHPAQGHVKRFEWIFEVDGTATTNCPSDKFSHLIKNGKNVVRLSVKKTVGPLTKFVKKWAAEKIVTLKLGKENDFQKRSKLVHFYCEDENGNKKDRILVWEIKPGTDTETSETLHRGDELLAVDDELVEGKKLAEIYKLILCKVPAEVKLKIKEIQHNMCNGEGMLTNSTAVDHEVEIPCNSPDISMPEENASQVFDDPTQCIIVGKEMDENAGREDSEVYVQNSSVLDEFEDESHPAVFETTVKPEADTTGSKKPTQESKKKQKLSFPILRRSSSKGSPGGNKVSNEVQKIANEGFEETPPPVRKFSPTSDKMCGKCVMKSETQLSDDRDKWPIDKIEHGCFHKMCELIDLPNRSKTALLIALGGFSNNEAESIIQEFTATGGKGMAKKALGMWGTSHRSHNVGALKTIAEHTMKRVDVLDEIEKWEKMFVCHGCGINLKEQL